MGTGTAALILGLHTEYVRSLIRRGRLQAAKENGEYRIPLAQTAELAAKGIGTLGWESGHQARMNDMLGAGIVIWSNPETGPA